MVTISRGDAVLYEKSRPDYRAAFFAAVQVCQHRGPTLLI